MVRLGNQFRFMFPEAGAVRQMLCASRQNHLNPAVHLHPHRHASKNGQLPGQGLEPPPARRGRTREAVKPGKCGLNFRPAIG
jgi:hypothetical protein